MKVSNVIVCLNQIRSKPEIQRSCDAQSTSHATMCEPTLVHCGVLSLPLAAGCAGLSENAGLAWLAQRTKKEPP